MNLKRSHTVLIRIYAKVNSRTYQIIFEMALDQRVKCENFQEFIKILFSGRSRLDKPWTQGLTDAAGNKSNLKWSLT